MDIGLIGTPYCDFQICTIVDGLQQLGHTVYDATGQGLNYMEIPTGNEDMDLFICADTDNLLCVDQPASVPKVILHGHDRWVGYDNAPDCPERGIRYDMWRGDIAFVRDWDGGGKEKTAFPMYPMEFGIESRFLQEGGVGKYWEHRTVDIAFFGTMSTARRQKNLEYLKNKLSDFNVVYSDQSSYTEPDEYWSRWVNGRYNHCPAYYAALSDAKFVFSPLGAGPSCARPYESVACGAIPLIQKYPPEIQQIYPWSSGIDCIVWEDVDELVSIVRHYLEHPEEGEELRDNTFEAGLKYRTSKSRAEYMLGKIQEHGLI
jgi:hypothetical protein